MRLPLFCHSITKTLPTASRLRSSRVLLSPSLISLLTSPCRCVRGRIRSVGAKQSLYKWRSVNYDSRRSLHRSGFVDEEGVFLSGEVDPEGWDAQDMANLTLVWDMGAGGCSGWGLEASQMVLSLLPFLGRVGVVAGPNSWCGGLSDAQLAQLEDLRHAHPWTHGERSMYG